MSKIRILPEHLANRIAAGEVVERPASVVKELLENSLDAGADRIEIEIEGGGTHLIRIIDNGEGMDEDDILLSLERHGTSKIQSDHDLDAISSLGFRGEALPSIGSVSRLVIASRRHDQELGTRVAADYGKLMKVHETGCRHGTTVEVGRLFGNTPARRKFLRTKRTELGHIDEVVKNCALAAPAVTLILRIDGKETLRLDGGLSLDKRLAAIMRYEGAFLQVDFPRPRDKRYVHGLLVPPEARIAMTAVLRLFVNGRPIKDRMMTHAAAEGMRGFLMKGRGPAGLLHLHLPDDEVDVNVHPAKHEVRFRSSHDVHELISQAVGRVMRELQGALRDEIFVQPKPRTDTPKEWTAFSAPPVERLKKPDPAPPPSLPFSTRENHPGSPTEDLSIQEPDPLYHRNTPVEPASGPEPDESSRQEPAGPALGGRRDHGLEVIGQFRDLYIFCRAGDSLVVIDQHAAHERLLFEKLKRQFLDGRIASQNLLFAQTVELSRFQSQLVEKNKAELERLGFSVGEFGGNTYIISAVPALAGRCDPGRLFIDILERFGSENEKSQGAGRLEDILADMACKAAVRSGDSLAPKEIDALLTRMADADLFSHCPHGRPVIKSFDAEEIKKWFYRP